MRRILVVIATLVVLAVVLKVYVSTDHGKGTLQSLRLHKKFAFDPERSLKVKIQREGEKYVKGKTKVGAWWLKEKPDASAETFRLLDLHKNKIQTILDRYQQVSPRTQEIRDAFKDFRLAVLDGGRLFYYIPDSENGAVPAQCSICFVPVAEANNPANPHSTFARWDDKANSMIMPAYEFAEPLLAGILFHEFGHGLLHSIRATPEGNDPLHAEEEVEMNSLGSLVMNEATGGEFFKAVDRVLDRDNPKDFKGAVASLTSEDMRSFDRIVGVGNGLMEGEFLNSEYYFIAGFRTIDRHHGSLADKAEGYRWVVRWTSSLYSK